MKEPIGNQMEAKEHEFLSASDNFALWFFCGVATVGLLVGFGQVGAGSASSGTFTIAIIAMLIVNLIRTRAAIRCYGRNVLDSLEDGGTKKSD